MNAQPIAQITPIRPNEAQPGMFDWIGAITGQRKVPVFTCPNIFVSLCDGDVGCAVFLAQVYYQQEQDDDKNAWVVFSGKKWAEYGISPYQLRRFAEKLAPYGLASKKCGVHPSITWHFQIDEAQLRHALEAHHHHATTIKNFTVDSKRVDDQRSKIAVLTIKNCSVNDQKFDSSIERDLRELQEERDSYDAIASASTADADAVPTQKPTSRSKQPRASPTTPTEKTTEPPALTALRAACFRLSKEVDDHPVAGQVAGIAHTFFIQGFTIAEIEGCWHESLRDPAFNNATRVPGIKDLLPNRIRAYRKNAASYHTEIDRRVAARQQQAERERKQHHGHVPTTRRTDLVDQPGYFDQPNAPGAQPAGLAENDPW